MIKLITILFLLPYNFLLFTPNANATNFSVEIKLENSKVLFIAKEGFTFNQISFNANRKVEMNQSGMLKFDKISKSNCPSDFIFEYSKSGNTIILKGIKGTNFKKLKLPFNQLKSSYVVSENGIENFN